MPKKILLIENDSAFAAQISESLEASGFDLRIAPEGKSGLDLAREWGPEAIVLCVELPGMSGYLICQKLRKNDATKEIPLILTSAEATPDTFEKHRALKVRADEYIFKPYVPADLLEKLAAIGLPAEPAPAGDGDPSEELVSLEEEMGLEALAAEPEAELPALDLQSLPDEPPPGGDAQPQSLDEDLSLLDEAFDGIAAVPLAPFDASQALDLGLDGDDEDLDPSEVDAAAASLAGEDADALDVPDLETDAALGALGALGDDDRQELDAFDLPAESPRSAGPAQGAEAPPAPALTIAAPVTPATAPAAAVFEPAPAPPAAPTAAPAAAPVGRLERELVEARQALADARSGASAREGELRQLRARSEEAARRADDAEGMLSERDADIASLRAKLETITGQARRAESELKAAREEGRRAADELADQRARIAELEVRAEAAEAEARRQSEENAGASDRSEALEREIEGLRTELVVARGEAEGARGEIEKRTAEFRKRIGDLEAASAKNEDRVLKAYQKIKGDEKVKDKVRKAVALVAQLLEEGLPPEVAAAEKERRTGAATLVDQE
jgi:CheY-like chemotaxis protein